ncbi:putative serine carboxypeptidase-like 23 [Hordeum vulgare]|nr:putative serine carboxypeptidase-like 23 [Hordeum vulgare]
MTVKEEVQEEVIKDDVIEEPHIVLWNPRFVGQRWVWSSMTAEMPNSGDFDSVCPLPATRYSIQDIGLPLTTPWRPWVAKGEVAGYVQHYAGGLTFLLVRGAGHLVPRALHLAVPEGLNMIPNFLKPRLSIAAFLWVLGSTSSSAAADYELTDHDLCAHIEIETSSGKELLVTTNGSSVLENQLMCLLDEKGWVNDNVIISAYICCLKDQVHV